MTQAPPRRRSITLTQQIFIGLLVGVLFGWFVHEYHPGWIVDIRPFSQIFLRMIKMIIAPLVFATVVAGIAGTGDAKTVGRIGLKALGWFISASVVSLLLGMALANLLQPGANLQLPLPDPGLATNLKTGGLSLKEFIVHVFPRSFFEAMATNEILQILVFSLFFGFALTGLKETPATTIVEFIDELAHAMLKLTGYVMLFAPLGVFGAMAAAIAPKGIGVLATYGKFIGTFYLSLVLLWAVLIAFTTASSEAAYPKLMERLDRFGVNERVTALTLPLGYSFNLDGSMVYQAFAALFIAQAYGIEMTFAQRSTLLFVMMISSKGVAGVPRASLVVVAAVLPMFGLPEAGLMLIMGIDHFLDMGRTATNVIGNGIATAVVAKWEGALGPPMADDDDAAAAAPTARAAPSA